MSFVDVLTNHIKLMGDEDLIRHFNELKYELSSLDEESERYRAYLPVVLFIRLELFDRGIEY